MCICKYISSCHVATNKTHVQHAAIQGWQVPDWAEQTWYNPLMGEVEPTGYTKAEQNVGKLHGGILHDRILLEVSNTLGLTMNSKPHPHLGNISCPQHKDHPLVW